ncbi:MAG: pantetheine-phosphate adenylyltransferase [Firmicutes bacterium]|jgi:pantetheine-phosphate adenylyltransferase|nr:pantetheine-phosphate adenylyltransferase [Bacillota bacterium]
MKAAMYPGSFDPVTNGHVDIITRASKVFDKLVVVVMKNSAKNPLFSQEERVRLIEEATSHLDNVQVDMYDDLLIRYAKEKNVNIVVKGLRAVSDFESEFQMAQINRKLYPNIETLFLNTSTEYSYLSSSIVKEIYRYDGDIKPLVPDNVYKIMKDRK